jgi:hypothetical protein
MTWVRRLVVASGFWLAVTGIIVGIGGSPPAVRGGSIRRQCCELNDVGMRYAISGMRKVSFPNPRPAYPISRTDGV